MTNLCSVVGCDKPRSTKGLCRKHYMRTWRHGSLTTLPRQRRRAGYRAVHGRIERDRGKASEYSCVECGCQAAHWAYDHSDRHALVDEATQCVYSMDTNKYQPMCARCHKRFDKCDTLYEQEDYKETPQ